MLDLGIGNRFSWNGQIFTVHGTLTSGRTTFALLDSSNPLRVSLKRLEREGAFKLPSGEELIAANKLTPQELDASNQVWAKIEPRLTPKMKTQLENELYEKFGFSWAGSRQRETLGWATDRALEMIGDK